MNELNPRIAMLVSLALVLGLAIGAASATAFTHAEAPVAPAAQGTPWSAAHAAIADDRAEPAPTF